MLFKPFKRNGFKLLLCETFTYFICKHSRFAKLLSRWFCALAVIKNIATSMAFCVLFSSGLDANEQHASSSQQAVARFLPPEKPRGKY